MDDESNVNLPQMRNTSIVAVGICITVVLLIILQHNLAFSGTIVLPAGGTYLGPTETVAPPPTEAPVPTISSQAPAVSNPKTAGGKFTVTKDAVWGTVKGNKYPYFFSSPSTLKLVTFPGDMYDIYAISWNNQPASQNVLIGVDNLNRTDTLKAYINISKRSYVENWWKQFGLKGIASITEFTNSQGLKGYRAKFLDAGGQTPNVDVFFEVPDPQYVIHLASGVLDSSVFDPLVDSVGWSTK